MDGRFAQYSSLRVRSPQRASFSCVLPFLVLANAVVAAPAPAASPIAPLLAPARELSAAAGRARLAELPIVRATAAPTGGTDAGVTGAGPAAAEGVVEALAGVVVVGFTETALGFAPPAGALPAPAADGPRPGLAVRAWAPWLEGARDGTLARIRMLFVDTTLSPDEAARRLAGLGGVAFAEPYYVHRLAALPNDPMLGEQLNLILVGAREAWDLSRGETRREPVAVVDGGMDITHPDLAPNVLLNSQDPPNGVDDDGNGYVDDTRGWNFAAGSDDPAAFAAMTPLAVRHGTHVAGLVSAVADNGLAIAGLTWNDPVLCVAAGDPARDDAVIYGYQGILYAAERGVRVINCSWGRLLTASLLEQAVLERVAQLGAVVVAAAGNDAQPFPFYPAAYAGVLGVANVTDTGERHPTSNYGRWVDLAAPGTAVLSLLPGGATGELTGTSMAAPLAAGGAALVWGREPALLPEAVLHRLRVTARQLDGEAPDEGPGLGSGLLDVASALVWCGPGYRLAGLTVTEENGDGDGRLEPGETAALRPLWRNLLMDGLRPIEIELTTTSGQATVLAGRTTLAPLRSGEAATTAESLRLEISLAAPVGTVVPLVWTLTGDEDGLPYRDGQASDLVVTPLFENLDAGEIKLTVSGNGRLGFAGRGGGDGSDGLGVRYVPAGQTEGSGPLDNLLFEGALLLGTAPDRINDAARYATNGAFKSDFVPAAAHDVPHALPPVSLPDGPERLARVAGAFRDDLAAAPLPVEVRWLGLAPLDANPPGVTLLLATVINRGAQALSGLRYGYFLDWDLNSGGYFPDFATNTTYYDPAVGAALTQRTEAPDGLNVATALVPEGGEPTRFRAIVNGGGSDGSWGIYDGFLDTEKWDCLSADDGPQIAAVADVSQVLAGGPVDLAPGDSARFVLVIAAGHTDQTARAQVAGGIALARRLFEVAVWGNPPEPFRVEAPYPNPWNGRVSLTVSGNPLATWELLVYDLRGRLVRRHAPALLAPGQPLTWDGTDAGGRPAPAGTYLLRVFHEGRTATRRAALVR